MRLAALGATALVGAACTSNPMPMFMHGHGYNAAANNKDELLRLAEGGDADAAYRLAIDYGVYWRNQEQSDFWLQRAATLGSVEAKQLIEDTWIQVLH